MFMRVDSKCAHHYAVNGSGDAPGQKSSWHHLRRIQLDLQPHLELRRGSIQFVSSKGSKVAIDVRSTPFEVRRDMGR